ncbi:MAG: AAA family ATPase [Archangium sp.]|nr:AAA family ATPase [Archangium sp.]MDP3570513.1 AAA family ATPase [Archangium sp.]
MARLLGFRVKNYRTLADLQLGQVQYARGTPLPRLTCLIGPNGSGKSTILDAFGFVADCLLEGVEAATDKAARGGFDRLRTQGQSGPIEFEIFFEDDDEDRPMVYELHVNLINGVPGVVKETLRQRQQGEVRGKPYYFLKLENGEGKVWAGQKVEVKAQKKDSQSVSLAEADKLGIATLGNLSEHPRIVKLRSYIEQWYLSYFIPEAARTLPAAGAQPRLDRTGSNIGNVLQYYKREYPSEFKNILKRLAKAIPGLKKIEPEISKDKRLLLRFDEAGYQDPFYQQSMSDGTLKMLAYAVLLEDPSPRPFIGIEEPENGLYVRLVERLASQFSQVGEKKAGTQILVTTHSPYFVDALQPEQVWLIRKNAKGHATAQRAADNREIKELTEQGVPLGSLWYSNHFEDGAPE